MENCVLSRPKCMAVKIPMRGMLPPEIAAHRGMWVLMECDVTGKGKLKPLRYLSYAFYRTREEALRAAHEYSYPRPQGKEEKGEEESND